MDSKFSDTVLQSSETSFPMSSSSSSGSGGIWESIKNVNMTTWLLIILILAFLGFNIFVYLAKGTEDIRRIFAPLLAKIFGTTVAVTGEAIDVTAEGAKVVVGGTAGAIESGLTAIQDITPNMDKTANKGVPVQGETQQHPQQPPSGLTRALQQNQPQQPQQMDYQANDASSSYDGTGGKSGWCYIGEDQGYRTCAQVGANDTCMSGDIFPTQEICMNPNLRH